HRTGARRPAVRDRRRGQPEAARPVSPVAAGTAGARWRLDGVCVVARAAAGRHGAGGESRSADWVSGRGPDVHDRRGALGAEGKREVTARPGSPGVALDPADPAFRADPYA